MKRRVAACAARCAALCAASGPAWAHGGGGPESGGSAVLLDLLLVLALALSAGAYRAGWWRLQEHAGPGRGLTRQHALAFAAGWGLLALALSPPADRLGGRLFSAHMLQHELLMVAVPPLLCRSRPLAAWAWAMAPSSRRTAGRILRHPAWARIWRGLTSPLGSTGGHALAVWAWHLPALFDAARQNPGWHALQHAAFLGTALLFWWSALRTAAAGRGWIAVAMLFATTLHTAALGALLALSGQVWYADPLPSARPFGLDALQDQQLGGLLMWVPGGLPYLLLALAIARRALSTDAATA